MSASSNYLKQLHSQTVELSAGVDRLLETISTEKDNEHEMNFILEIMDKRESIISMFDEEFKKNDPVWSEEEQALLVELKSLQGAISPKLNRIFSSYQVQLQRFQQGKKVAKGYYNQSVYADGTFIDKKK
ncbi:hypothetical protein [Bacillus horti]|nr:hypothetical protein [Bacillus horti]